MLNSRLLLLLTFALFGVAVAGQTAHKQTPKDTGGGQKLIAIRVTGSQRFTPEEIISASGLKIGQAANDDDFKKVTRDLGDTGLFTDISYSYAYSSGGTKLDLQVVDTDKVVPARFDNFVWFSDDDLTAKIHQREPLFKGLVPVGGNLSDLVSDVLQSLLLQRGLSARANYIREGQDNDGPIDAVNFKADGVNIRVRGISFPGAPPEEEPRLQAAAKQLQGKDYLRSETNAYARRVLIPVYLEHGFLKATFAEPKAKVVDESPDETHVEITLPSTSGLQYKLSSLMWESNTVFPAEKLQSLIHVQPGQPANAIQLKADLEALHRLYTTRGYMTAHAKADPEFDEAKSSVAYKLLVHEGSLFHLGDLDINGVDTKTADRLRGAWALRPEDPYDSSYPQRFIAESWKLLPSTTGWTAAIHEGVNEKDNTVDVSVRYTKKFD